MDKNRLVQIANHFDKIGAYTISDEFENKFIRIAAPADDPTKRKTEVQQRLTSGSYRNVISEFIGLFGSMKKFLGNSSDLINAKRDSYNLLETWGQIIVDMSKDSNYNSKKQNIGRMAASIISAKSNFRTTLPNIISSKKAEPNAGMILDVQDIYGDNDALLTNFGAFVDSEVTKYDGMPALTNYLIALRGAEVAFYNLAASTNLPAPSVPTPVKPATSAPASSAPASSAPATTKPNQVGGNAPSPPSSGNKPSSSTPAPSGRTQSVPSGSTQSGTGGGSGSPVSPSGKPSQPSTKQTSTPSSKTTNLSVNEELSKIVFRKVKASNPKLQDDNIFLDMRIDNKYKTYLDVSKDKSLDGSIRAAIKASSFSDEFKQKLIKRLDAKIAKAIEFSKKEESKPTEVTTPTQTQTQTPAQTPAPEPPKDPAKPDADGFRCSREGLFTEIGRMDTLHNNDPDKYIRSYFGDIKRVIDCHESIRNSLNHKDNIQLDTLINILEAKYFSLINKTQFPY